MWEVIRTWIPCRGNPLTMVLGHWDLNWADHWSHRPSPGVPTPVSLLCHWTSCGGIVLISNSEKLAAVHITCQPTWYTWPTAHLSAMSALPDLWHDWRVQRDRQTSQPVIAPLRGRRTVRRCPPTFFPFLVLDLCLLDNERTYCCCWTLLPHPLSGFGSLLVRKSQRIFQQFLLYNSFTWLKITV